MLATQYTRSPNLQPVFNLIFLNLFADGCAIPFVKYSCFVFYWVHCHFGLRFNFRDFELPAQCEDEEKRS